MLSRELTFWNGAVISVKNLFKADLIFSTEPERCEDMSRNGTSQGIQMSLKHGLCYGGLWDP